MSETKPVPPLPEGVLSEELLQKIGGGECTLEEWNRIFADLRTTYENLVDFTSYVFERVTTSLN